MKPLVIYHADCTDGFGAAFAAWKKLGDDAEYVPCQYGGINPANLADLTDDREVYILDFSFPRVQMDSLFTNAKRVVWLDHHKTAFEMWCDNGERKYYRCLLDDRAQHHITLDNDKSGALLAWEYFHPGTEVPMLIKHIDDRDRWQWKLEGSAEIHAALGAMKPWSFRQWDELRHMHKGMFDHGASAYTVERYERVLAQGSAILRAQKQHIEQMVKQARECYLKLWCEPGTTCGPVALGLAVNSPIHQSEVGHELANASGTFGLVWYLAADNRVKCSLRSNGEYDVSAIARGFGGGGHKNAAGFETDIQTLMGWIK